MIKLNSDGPDLEFPSSLAAVKAHRYQDGSNKYVAYDEMQEDSFLKGAEWAWAELTARTGIRP